MHLLPLLLLLLTTTNTTMILWPLYRTTWAISLPQLRTGGFCSSSFTAHMSLLMTTSTFGLGRVRVPQWCYLYHFSYPPCTISAPTGSPAVTCLAYFFQVIPVQVARGLTGLHQWHFTQAKCPACCQCQCNDSKEMRRKF